MTVSAIAIDHLGRIRTQSWAYLAGGIAVFIMGLGISPNAVLAVSIVGRMAVMAASVWGIFFAVIIIFLFIESLF